jgi:hypothetical protein
MNCSPQVFERDYQMKPFYTLAKKKQKKPEGPRAFRHKFFLLELE